MAKEKEAEMLSEESYEDVGGDPRVYELGFHIDPELPVEEVKKLFQTTREMIGGKGTVVAEGEPEKIPLAYTISRQEPSGRRDFNSAYFSWIAYEAAAADHSEILASVHADKRVIRFIDLLTTKDAARHAVEMHELSMKMPERTEDSETVLRAELDAALESAVV